jgi:ABC-type Fe3+-hydroxamate transport system substrate-binding protein
MIDLPQIQKMWEQDSKIDPDNLHTESLNIPVLHAKYYDLYNNLILLRKKAEQQRKNDTMLKYLEEILKQISNRTYQIKNAIEFMRFSSGLG